MAATAALVPGLLFVQPAHASLLDPVLSQILDTSTTVTTEELQQTLTDLTTTEQGQLLDAATTEQATALIDGLSGTQLDGALDTLSADALGDVLTTVTSGDLDTVLATLDTTQLTGALDTLLPAELGDLLASLSGGELDTVLGTLDATELAGALGTLDPTELTSVVAALDPATVTALLDQAGGLQALLDGLTGVVDGLTAGTPAAGAVDDLLAQIEALLAVGIPVDQVPLDQLQALLEQLPALITETAGLDATGLTRLYDTVTGLLTTALPGPIAGTLNSVADSTATKLGIVRPPAKPTSPTTDAPVAPATTAPVAGLAKKPAFTRYRARVSKVRIAKNRRTATVKVSCPMAAPTACVVVLSGKVGGKRALKAVWVGVPRASSKTVKLKLTAAATKRLKKKGGALKVTAATAYSSLGSLTAKATVKRPKRHAKRR